MNILYTYSYNILEIFLLNINLEKWNIFVFFSILSLIQKLLLKMLKSMFQDYNEFFQGLE